MMHHHNRFGYERLSAPEYILWTKLNRRTDKRTDGQADMVNTGVTKRNKVGVGGEGGGKV